MREHGADHGRGNERTHVHLPTLFGYENTSANWQMVTHLVNLKPFTQTVYVEMVFRQRPLSETQKARPIWLDIDGCGGDSEYTIPTGYSTPTPTGRRPSTRA